MNPEHTPSPLPPELERQAQRNVALRLGWLAHATVFTLVTAGLWLAGHQRGWLGLPTGGWAIGLLVHGLVVWLRPAGEGVKHRLLRAERQRLRNRA
jgi:hypothetical protein